MAAESVVVSCERVDFHDFLARLCTVVAFVGLHFRAFHLLTSAASHDLKETIDKDYCFLQGLRGRFPVNKLNPKKLHMKTPAPYKLSK